MAQPARWKPFLFFNCFGLSSKGSCDSAASTELAFDGASCSSNSIIKTDYKRPEPEAISANLPTTFDASAQSGVFGLEPLASSVTCAMPFAEPLQQQDRDSAYLPMLRLKGAGYEFCSSAASISRQLPACVPTAASQRAGRQQPADTRRRCFPQGVHPLTERLLEMRSQVCQLQLLGRGGQALVLRGVWQLAQVAVKLAVANPASTPASTLAKLLNEGPLSQRLRAPNIVQTYCHSVTRLTQQDLQDCQEADELPLDSPRQSLPTWAYPGWGAAPEDLGEELLEFVMGQCPQGRGQLPAAPLCTFDSCDGFGSPVPARSSVLSYSEALSAAGAAPNCYLTQIVMEYCDCGSLADAVSKDAYAGAAYDRAALFAYLRTLYDIAAGMSYLHSNGVIHGDLKPGNVLLQSSRVDLRGYQAKVADFGLSQCTSAAAAAATGDSRAAAAADWSSYPYMAPEHFAGELVAASDVWSFAATAHHMWSGGPPHGGLHAVQVCAGVCDGSLRLDAPAGMPGQLRRLLSDCMTHKCGGRPDFPTILDTIKRLQKEWFGM